MNELSKVKIINTNGTAAELEINGMQIPCVAGVIVAPISSESPNIARIAMTFDADVEFVGAVDGIRRDVHYEDKNVFVGQDGFMKFEPNPDKYDLCANDPLVLIADRMKELERDNTTDKCTEYDFLSKLFKIIAETLAVD